MSNCINTASPGKTYGHMAKFLHIIFWKSEACTSHMTEYSLHLCLEVFGTGAAAADMLTRLWEGSNEPHFTFCMLEAYHLWPLSRQTATVVLNWSSGEEDVSKFSVHKSHTDTGDDQLNHSIKSLEATTPCFKYVLNKQTFTDFFVNICHSWWLFLWNHKVWMFLYLLTTKKIFK